MDNKTRSDLAAVPTGIETEHLSRTVLDRALVSDISVQVRRGEILAVVGPSGAGKSSFLRLLNRLDEPTRGTVRLNGQDYREFPAHRPRGVVANERMCRERCSTVGGWSDCRFSCAARIPVCQGALRSNKAPNLLRQRIVQLQQRLVSQLVVAHALASCRAAARGRRAYRCRAQGIRLFSARNRRAATRKPSDVALRPWRRKFDAWLAVSLPYDYSAVASNSPVSTSRHSRR
jgi:ABC-type dipeptide/oligopeptide/nickel transport system ATPase component